MAKIIKQPKQVTQPKLVANIIVYWSSSPTAPQLMFTDMKRAQRQYDLLFQWIKSQRKERTGEVFVLRGDASTLTIGDVIDVAGAQLIAIQESNMLTVDGQMHINKLMQAAQQG